MLKKALLVAAVGALTTAACANEIKIGFLGTLSGAAADVGRDQIDGFNLALEQLGGKLGGVRAKVVREDDQAKPEVALEAVTKLLEREKVDVMTGLTYSHVFLSLQKKIAATDVPFVGSVAGPSAYAGAQCRPNLFVASWPNDGPAEAMGKYLTDKGIKRISTLTANFVGGKDKIAGLKRFYKGEIVEEIYSPLNQLDFSAELTKVAAAKPEAVFAFYPGGLGVTFVRQYQQAGLHGTIPLYTINTVEGASLEAMGAAAVGSVVTDAWTTGHPGEDTRRFVEAFRGKHQRLPSPQAAFSYDVAMLLDAAVRSLKGHTTDRKALSKAIESVQFKSLRGAFRFGTNHFPVQDYHAYKVVSAGGKPNLELLQAQVLKSHADAYVSQCAGR